MQFAEAVADDSVEGGRFLPPLGRLGFGEPEGQDVVGRDRWHWGVRPCGSEERFPPQPDHRADSAARRALMHGNIRSAGMALDGSARYSRCPAATSSRSQVSTASTMPSWMLLSGSANLFMPIRSDGALSQERGRDSKIIPR